MTRETLGMARVPNGPQAEGAPSGDHARPQRTVGDYLAILRRRKWALLAPILIVPTVAYVLAAQQPTIYAASSAVLLSRDNLGSQLSGITDADVLTNSDRFAATQAELARVPEVFSKAVDLAGSSMSPSELFSNSSVTALGNADLLSFTVQSEDPALAPRMATAYAQAFTAYKLELDTAALTNARRELERGIAALREAGATDTPEYRELTRRRTELRTLELLQTQAAVVKEPDNAAQVAPVPRRDAVLGLAVGLLLGLGAAFLWEALDKRVRDEDEIGRILGLPLLARLPAPRQESGRPRPVMLEDASDREAEAIRRLRSNVEFANLDVNAKSILVTSAVPGDGKSLTVTNLALALARADRRVVLVDLDLRKPSIGSLLGIGYRPGITDVAIERTELMNTLVPIRLQTPSPVDLPSRGRRRVAESETPDSGADSPHGQLWVLPAGFLPAGPGELVGTRAVARIISELEDRFDFVMIDAPPLFAVSDAITLSTRVDAMLVVVRLGVANRSMLRELDRQLDACPARTLGFVLAGADRGEHYGAYGYGDRESARDQKRARPAAAPALTESFSPEFEPAPAPQRRP